MATRLSLPAREIRKGLKISVVEGSFATVHITITAIGGVVINGLVIFLGATQFEIGLLSAIPALLAPLAFLGVWLVALTGNRKLVTALTAGAGRSIFFIPAFILLFGGKMDMHFVLLLVGLFNAFIVITGNTWTSWMSDLVPRNRWGRYFGLRNIAVGIVGMVSSWGGAFFLDRWKIYFLLRNLSKLVLYNVAAGAFSTKVEMPQRLFENPANLGQGFGLVFLVASICSTVSLILLVNQPYPSRAHQPVRLRETIMVPLGDKSFRRLLVFLAFWFLTSGIASPFYGVHMLQNLKMYYSQAAIYGVAAGLVGLLFQLIWGRIIDRIHPKPVLEICFFGVAFLPLLWLFASPRFYLPIWIDAVLTGIFWTGVNAALFTMMLGSLTEPRLKESYIALYSTVIGICGFVSSLVGGIIAQTLAGFKLELFGFTFINYHVLFLAASLFRFAALPLLARVEAPGVPGIKVTLAAMGNYAARRLYMGKGFLENAFLSRTPRNGAARKKTLGALKKNKLIKD